MNSEELTHVRSLIRRLLGEAQDHAGAGSMRDALRAVRKARGLDPTNVFILAFERQMEQMEESAAKGTLTDDQRRDILTSLPGIIERTLMNETLLVPDGSAPDGTLPPVPPGQVREHVRAARQWLKNQYIQRAHEFVKDREYDRALAEVRRILVIDEKDRFAREFELRILQMQEVQRRKVMVSPESPPRPTPFVVPASRPILTLPSRPARGKLLLWVAIGATVVVVLAAAWFFVHREPPRAVSVEPGEEITVPEDDEPYLPLPPAVPADTLRADSTRQDGLQR